MMDRLYGTLERVKLCWPVSHHNQEWPKGLSLRRIQPQGEPIAEALLSLVESMSTESLHTHYTHHIQRTQAQDDINSPKRKTYRLRCISPKCLSMPHMQEYEDIRLCHCKPLHPSLQYRPVNSDVRVSRIKPPTIHLRPTRPNPATSANTEAWESDFKMGMCDNIGSNPRSNARAQSDIYCKCGWKLHVHLHID